MIIGFDIGGTKSAVILAADGGEIIDRIAAPTEVSEGPDATISRMISDAETLIQRNNASRDILGVGISCGGPLDRIAGVICGPPNLPGWDNVPVVRKVKEALGLPTFLENDADACALAEYLFGAGVGKGNVVFFTWGTGVGSGMVLDGRLYTGAGGQAGEIGHIVFIENGRPCACGKRGCIETYASGSSMTRMACEAIADGRTSMLSEADAINGKTISDAARRGDELALEVLSTAARAMGRAVAIAAHTLNPNVITLGTMAFKARDLLMPTVLRVVEQEVWNEIKRDLVVMPTPLGDRIQDLSTVAAFLGRFSLEVPPTLRTDP